MNTMYDTFQTPRSGDIASVSGTDMCMIYKIEITHEVACWKDERRNQKNISHVKYHSALWGHDSYAVGIHRFKLCAQERTGWVIQFLFYVFCFSCLVVCFWFVWWCVCVVVVVVVVVFFFYFIFNTNYCWVDNR